MIAPDVTEPLPIPLQDEDNAEINPVQLFNESAELEAYFDEALHVADLHGLGNADYSEDEDEEQSAGSGGEEMTSMLDDATSTSIYAWVDQFILETRRKGGRQTEESVLRQWKVCVQIKIHSAYTHLFELTIKDLGTGSYPVRPHQGLDCRREPCH